MTPLFLYLLKVNIALLLFYLAYRYGLRRLTFYTLNRFYLLLAIGFSSVYPFIDLSGFINGRAAGGEIIYYLPDLSGLARESPFEIWNILTFIFWAGVAVMAARFLLQFISLVQIHFSSVKQGTGKQTVRIVKEKINPFSFFRNIYVNPLLHSPEEWRSIIEHEQVHVKEWHTADILAGELNRIFYWFNPGAWLVMTAIRENLEFITDRKVLQSGADARAYQYSLVKVSEIPYASSLANNFNFSHLKIRITMMDKKPSSELHLVKYLVLVPFVAATALAFNVSKAELKESVAEVVKITDLVKLPPAGDTIPEKAPAVREVRVRPPEVVPQEEEKTASVASFNVVRFNPPVIRKKNDTLGSKVRLYKAEGEQLLVIDTANGKDVYSGKEIVFNIDRELVTVKEPTRIELDTARTPLVIIDGEKATYQDMEDLPPGEIYSVEVLKEGSALKEYGGKGKDGVLIITTRKEAVAEGLRGKLREMRGLSSARTALAGRQQSLADTQAVLSGMQETLADSQKARSLWREILVDSQAVLALRQAKLRDEAITYGITFNKDSIEKDHPTFGVFGPAAGTTIELEDALVVIDGKISSEGFSSKTNNLDPDDIKSISILKGTAAFLKYGEKGKKGVIVITTKDEK